MRLELALEAADLGLWEWDLASDTWSWDERSAVVLGFGPGRRPVTFGDVERLIDPRDRPRVLEAIGGAVGPVGPVHAEFRLDGRGDREHWISVQGQVLAGEDGRPVRVVGVCSDVTGTRRTELQATEDATAMAGLVAVAQDLGAADSEAAVLRVVTDRGTPLLGARAMGLAVMSADRTSVRTLSTDFDAEYLASVATLPADLRLPLVDTAVSGEAHFLSDLASTVDAFPDALPLYLATGVHASAAVSLRDGERVFGSLSVAYASDHRWRSAERELLTAFAALTSQALLRISAREAERAAGLYAESFAETFQLSLLSRPLHPEDLELAVRYTPSAAQAQVGGDWYDAFVTVSGTSTMVIGDVVGHDRHAAALMGQLRNLLRGVCYTVDGPPARVLSTLDAAMADFGVEAVASAAVFQIAPADAGSPTRRLLWSNAGHPPPVLLRADGEVGLLGADPDLLIGVLPGIERSDHETWLAPGDTLLLYTDGLVERRNALLQDGLDWLAGAVRRLGPLDVEELADTLLAEVGQVADDVALLVLRLPVP